MIAAEGGEVSIQTSTTSVPASADEGMVRAAASGDPAAFESLAQGLLDRSYRLACAILGSQVVAAEVTQDALVAAWRELPRLEAPGGFEAWFRRLLVDECRMRLRHAPRPEPGATPTFAGWRSLAALAGGSDEVDRETVLDALEAVYEGLDADDRAIVALHHLEGASAAEIGALLHLPAGTVKMQLHDTHAAFVDTLETL